MKFTTDGRPDVVAFLIFISDKMTINQQIHETVKGIGKAYR